MLIYKDMIVGKKIMKILMIVFKRQNIVEYPFNVLILIFYLKGTGMTAIKIEIKKFPISFKICFDEYLKKDNKTEKKEMCHNITSEDKK